MQTQEAPYRVEEITLRKVADSPMFAKGWFTKVADEQEDGPFVVPLDMFLKKFSDCNPELDEPRTAFFNQSENCILLIPTYSHQEIITLLYWTAALDYDI